MDRRLMIGAVVLLGGATLLEGAAPAQRGARSRGKPPVQVEPSVAALGDMRPGEVRSARVTLTNGGDAPVVIGRIRTTCRCTVVEAPVREIGPGASLELTATLEAPEAFGEVGQHAAVIFEGYAAPVQVRLTADVSKGVRVRRTYEPPGQGLTGVIELSSVGGEAFGVASVDGGPPVYVDGFDPAVDPARAVYRLRQSVEAGPDGATPKWLVIELDHPTSPIIDLPVEDPRRLERRSRAAWRPARDRYVLDAIEAGRVAEALVELRGLTGDPAGVVEWFEGSAAGASVELLGVRTMEDGRGAVLRVGILPDPGRRGLLDASVTVRASGHSATVHVLARVEASGADGEGPGAAAASPDGAS